LDKPVWPVFVSSGFSAAFESTKQKDVFLKQTDRNTYRLWVEKPKRKRLLGRPRCKWEDNIRMDINETG